MSQPAIASNTTKPKPVLKWAGGKTQLIKELSERFPKKYNKFIEPFIGGGALFFHEQPEKAVIADSNPELINLYRTLVTNVEDVILHLAEHKNEEEYFYNIRQQDWRLLQPVQAASRLIYLNRTCFNGLYRVNKKGQFNVPFGRYKNPRICDADNLRAAAELLGRTDVIYGDYKKVLKNHAKEGDLIYLDPPYLPISAYSDFKRYTKEQFYEEDHVELANQVKGLHELGCYVILSNSNHLLVHELYSDFKIEVVQCKRNINSKGEKRTGEDVIITVPPKRTTQIFKIHDCLPEQVSKYPSTRYMGSKNKLLTHIWEAAEQFDFETVLDLFSGSGVVSYMFKAHNKTVISNDYMALSATYAKAMISNNTVTLKPERAKALLEGPVSLRDTFVQDTFKELYFTDEENYLIDVLRHNIANIKNPYEKAIAIAALTRACTKKRPRGIFTYTGQRYDDGRKDLKMSLEEQFVRAVRTINASVFDNGKNNYSRRGDAMDIRKKADLVYLDPPYYSPLSDNEYVRRYHFVEGLACNWENVEMQWHTKTKKFKNYPTPFASRKGAHDAFDKLFRKFKNSILLVSYSSNSLPTLDEMVSLMSKYKSKVDVVKVDYKYSFGTQVANGNGNSVQEYLFIGH